MLVSRVWLGRPAHKRIYINFLYNFLYSCEMSCCSAKSFHLKKSCYTKKCRALPSPTHLCLVFWAAWWIDAPKMGEMDSWKWIFFIRLYGELFQDKNIWLSVHFTREREKCLEGLRIFVLQTISGVTCCPECVPIVHIVCDCGSPITNSAHKENRTPATTSGHTSHSQTDTANTLPSYHFSRE